MPDEINQVIENNKKINQMIEQIIAERRKSRIPFEVNGKIDENMRLLLQGEIAKCLEIYKLEFSGYNCQGREGITFRKPKNTADCYGGTDGLQVTYRMQDFIETRILPEIKKLGYSINENGEAYYDSSTNTEHTPNSDLKAPQKFVGSTKDQMDQFAMMFAKNGIDMDFVWDALAHEEMHTYGVTSGNSFLKEGTTEELTREICEKYGIHMSPTAHTQETEFVRKLEMIVGRDKVIASGMWTGKFKEEHFKEILEKHPEMDYRTLSEMFELIKSELSKLEPEETDRLNEFKTNNPEIFKELEEKVNLYKEAEDRGDRYCEVAKEFDECLGMEGSFFKYAKILENFYSLTLNHKKDPDFYRDLYSMTLDEFVSARGYETIDEETLSKNERKIFKEDKALVDVLRTTIAELKKENNLNINGYSNLMAPINQYIQDHNCELEVDNFPKDYTEVLRVQEDEFVRLQEIIRIQNAEKISLFHNQKSDEFFEDKQGQRRYIVTTQAIGKATVNTPIEQKQEAERVGASNIKRIQELEDEQIEQ